MSLAAATRDNYRLNILATVCLLIRVKFLISSKKAPKGLKLYVSQRQTKARDTLYNLYLDITNQSYLPALHQLLVSILCHSTNNKKLACPTDYSMCLACLEKGDFGWTFKAPSNITGKFAGLQYCFQMVFFTHCYTIAVNGGLFKSLSNPTPKAQPAHQPDSSSHTLTVPQPDLLVELEEIEGCEDAIEVVEPEHSQFSGDKEEIEIADEENDQGLVGYVAIQPIISLSANGTFILFRTIVDQSQWISIRNLDSGFHTPFNRLKRNWLTIYPASTSDITKRINSWSPEGDILTLVTTYGEPMKIHLREIKPAVDLLFEELATTLTQLFPNGVKFPPKVTWEPKDNLGTSAAFVEQPDFMELMSPIYSQFHTNMVSPDESTHQIWSGSKFQARNFKKWLDLE